MKEQFGLLIHAVLLLGALCTYLIEPDDVVWQLIQGASNVRFREHICFAIAAVTLGLSLWLRAKMDTQLDDSDAELDKLGLRRIASDCLQAVGIGSLMPLGGFILLVFGETAFSVLRYSFRKEAGSELAGPDRVTQNSLPEIEAVPCFPVARQGGWRRLLSRHAGLFCAFLSMVVFSITLSDRLADCLFAGTALVTVLANLRRQRTWH